MSEDLMHEPKIETDDEAEVYFLKCAICGKILWYPDADDPCDPPPPALGINVSEGVGAKDRFGG